GADAVGAGRVGLATRCGAVLCAGCREQCGRERHEAQAREWECHGQSPVGHGHRRPGCRHEMMFLLQAYDVEGGEGALESGPDPRHASHGRTARDDNAARARLGRLLQMLPDDRSDGRRLVAVPVLGLRRETHGCATKPSHPSVNAQGLRGAAAKARERPARCAGRDREAGWRAGEQPRTDGTVPDARIPPRPVDAVPTHGGETKEGGPEGPHKDRTGREESANQYGRAVLQYVSTWRTSESGSGT